MLLRRPPSAIETEKKAGVPRIHESAMRPPAPNTKRPGKGGRPEAKTKTSRPCFSGGLRALLKQEKKAGVPRIHASAIRHPAPTTKRPGKGPREKAGGPRQKRKLVPRASREASERPEEKRKQVARLSGEASELYQLPCKARGRTKAPSTIRVYVDASPLGSMTHARSIRTGVARAFAKKRRAPRGLKRAP